MYDEGNKIGTSSKKFINRENPKLVYQYRNFESFWLIVNSESFWATNARFSNDKQEQIFLTENFNGHSSDCHSENFIVCFCKENDILSQWRGYAPKGGVSIGFDFSSPREYTIEKNGNMTTHITALGDVEYLVTKKYFEENKRNFNFNTYFDYLDSIGIRKSVPISTIAGYVKHKGFEEEKELRLVFTNESDKLNDYINYKVDSADTRIKVPYIVVKAGNYKHENRSCSIRSYSELTNSNLLDLEKRLSGQVISSCVSVENCKEPQNKKLTDGFCFGCTRRKMMALATANSYCRYGENENSFCIDATDNSIIISQGKDQEKIFNIVYNYVESLNLEDKKPEIWCEGHLPIRSITIGPCENQDELVESITYYCRHTYWLKCVDINVSEIPYKQPKL